MKKSILKALVLICSVFVFQNVKAKDIAYKNEFGLELIKTEYQNNLAIYEEDYLKKLTNSDFVKYKEYYSYPNLKIDSNEDSSISAFYGTNYKRLSVINITNSSPTALVVVPLKWKQMPKIKSYDVIEVQLYNTSFIKLLSNGSSINQMDGKSFKI